MYDDENSEHSKHLMSTDQYKDIDDSHRLTTDIITILVVLASVLLIALVLW